MRPRPHGATGPAAAERPGRLRGLLVALGATIAFAFALGSANGVGMVVEASGAPTLVVRLARALLCAGTMLALAFLLCRAAGRDLPWAGLRRRGALVDLATGTAVVTGSAVFVLAPAVALGEIEVVSVSVGTLLPYLLLTVVVGVGQEAFPEELAFRGVTFSGLRAAAGRALAAVATTVCFVSSVGLSQVPTSAVVRLAGAGEPPWYQPVPSGEDPAVYLPVLVVWSICLICARLLDDSVWTAVPTHLGLLVVNRMLLDPSSGVVVDLAGPDVLLVVPAYVLLTALVFVLLRRRRARRPQVRWAR